MAETKQNLSTQYLYPCIKRVGADELLTEEDTDGTEVILDEDGNDIEGEDR